MASPPPLNPPKRKRNCAVLLFYLAFYSPILLIYIYYCWSPLPPAVVLLANSCNDGRDLEQDDGQTTTQMCNPPLVHSLSISGDGNSLATGCGDCTVVVYSLGGRRGQMAQRLRLASGGHSASVGTVHFPVFAPNSRVLSGGNDRKICLWDVTLPPSASVAAAAAATPPLATLTHSEKINWITSAPAGCIYVADTSATVKAFKVEE